MKSRSLTGQDMSKTFKFGNREIRLETESDKIRYWSDNEEVNEFFIDLHFKTPTCNDAVFLHTSEGGKLPSEIADDVHQFNLFVDELIKARKKVNKSWKDICEKREYDVKGIPKDGA